MFVRQFTISRPLSPLLVQHEARLTFRNSAQPFMTHCVSKPFILSPFFPTLVCLGPHNSFQSPTTTTLLPPSHQDNAFFISIKKFDQTSSRRSCSLDRRAKNSGCAQSTTADVYAGASTQEPPHQPHACFVRSFHRCHRHEHSV